MADSIKLFSNADYQKQLEEVAFTSFVKIFNRIAKESAVKGLSEFCINRIEFWVDRDIYERFLVPLKPYYYCEYRPEIHINTLAIKEYGRYIFTPKFDETHTFKVVASKLSSV